MPLSFPTSPTLNQTYTYSGRTWIWTGSVWQSVGTAQGVMGSQGLQGVQGLTGPAGVGLSTAFTAKGDLVVGTGSGTYATQPVGGKNQLLLADSSQADGVRWGDDKDIMSIMGAY